MKSIIYLFSLVLCLFAVQHTAQAQLSEGFEGTFPPTGWAFFDNGVQQSQSWEKKTTNPNSGSAHAFVKFSSSTTILAEDWLVTPKLLPDGSNSTLTFFGTDDFPDNFGSIYTVRVSTTSQTDRSSFVDVETYTESNFTADVYQQFTVDLSAYIDQEIYVAFVLENSKGDSWLLDDVAGPPVVTITTIPNCDVELIQPTADALNAVPVDITLMWSAATGDPTGYNIQIGTTQGGSEFLAMNDVASATSYKPAMDFDYNTRYYVTITPYNAIGNAANCQEFEFITEIDPDITLDCAGSGLSEARTLCYKNNEVEEFTITSNNSDQVNISFIGGTVENNQDEIYIYDGADDTGQLLNAGKLYGNAGDLTGLSYTSTTGSLFIRLTPDGSNSCNNGNQTVIDFTASCAACTPPIAIAEAGTCDGNNDEFFIDVAIVSLGSDGSVTISNNQNANTDVVTMTGITTVGPFNFGTVTLTVETTNTQCDIELLPITVNGCPPANDECFDASVLTVSTDENCENAVSGTTEFSTISTDDGICSPESFDVWYSFTSGSTDSYVFELSNLQSFMSVAIYSGTCAGGLTLLNEDCLNDGMVVIDLTASTTYLVQVFADDELTTGSFDLCVYPEPSGAICLDNPANDPCNDIEVTDATIEGDVVACETIVTSGVVTIASGTTASFEAGTSITLTTGFTAEAGSTFTASIVPCGGINEAPAIENRSEEVPNEDGTDFELKVQPNPAHDEMNIQMNLPKAERLNIVLTDISGKTLRALQEDANKGWNQFNLQRKDLADGMYFLTVMTATERKTVKIILTK